MEEIKVFENKEFGKVRTVLRGGEPWFVGKDVTSILGYERTTKAIVDRVDDEDRKMIDSKTQSQIGIEIGQRGGWLINESGLYSLILSSKLPRAKEFKRWVTSEVLPTIRKTGGYVANEELFVNTYLSNADQATKELFKLNLQTIRQLNEKIEKDKPLVDFANHIQVSDDCISMSAMAKLAAKNGINIGRTRLFSYLRDKKILGCHDGYKNIPYQRYIDTQPWFEVRESTYVRDGQVHINLTPMVTPKGQNGIIRMLKKDF